ncbi:MAG TPA: potassium channel protein [Stellaceae bacterium]|nr:potassium channel protein [Stellaceae bacterium]
MRALPTPPEIPGPDEADRSGGQRRALPARAAHVRPGGVRRAPKPKMTGLLDSPGRNLAFGVGYIVSIMVLATGAYMSAGWSLHDALYMVVTTIYTVGYEEVRPIDTTGLYLITLSLIVFGCTGIIFLTGVLVQFITLSQLTKVMGHRRMQRQIDHLSEHVIVCGFGRIGVVLARALAARSAGFVIIEQNPNRAAEAQEQGFLCLNGDAALESTLHAAGVGRAQVLATVLPNDAVNVFITLSARALNPELSIIARGELSSTEGKLLQAGANKVVLPTVIGAERIAELILFEESARYLDGLDRNLGFQTALHALGVELEVITAAPNSPAVGMTIAAIERQARGSFLIVQIDRGDGDVFTSPTADTTIRAGDGVVLLGRPNRAGALLSLFETRRRVGLRG